MATIIPDSDQVKKAIKWIDGERQDHPEIPIVKWVEKAAFQFDLSPMDTEFLLGFYRKATLAVSSS